MVFLIKIELNLNPFSVRPGRPRKIEGPWKRSLDKDTCSSPSFAPWKGREGGRDLERPQDSITPDPIGLG